MFLSLMSVVVLNVVGNIRNLFMILKTHIHVPTHTAAEDGSEDDVLTVKPTTWRLKLLWATLHVNSYKWKRCATSSKAVWTYPELMWCCVRKTASCILLYVSHRGLEQGKQCGDQLSLDSCSSFMFWFFTSWFPANENTTTKT